jgi:nitroimidazol reductase NimA-like FMN-containing flavoprotein (pyridoxamine 5'-phosphate oxidase superfamily)
MKHIRRKEREITTQEAIEILDSAEYGVLSTVGEDDQPYGVPICYVHKNGSIYFHCALGGHKLDNIRHNEKVSFCVVGKTKVLPEKFALNMKVPWSLVLRRKSTAQNGTMRSCGSWRNTAPSSSKRESGTSS